MNTDKKELTLFAQAILNWKRNSSKVYITSMHIILLSYFKSNNSTDEFTHDLGRHFSTHKSIKKQCFELIKAIDDYNLGILYIKEVGEFSHMVKKFHKSVFPFCSENNLRNIDFDETEISTLKSSLISVIKNLR